MAKITTEGVIEGIDFSATMLEEAKKLNKEYILNKRVNLREGECLNLPFNNESFDKLCTVNTIYFLKEPNKYLLEMFRVIKSGGRIVIGFRDDKQLSNLNISKSIFSTYSKSEVVNMLSDDGFKNARVEEKKGKPFHSYCAIATKE